MAMKFLRVTVSVVFIGLIRIGYEAENVQSIAQYITILHKGSIISSGDNII